MANEPDNAAPNQDIAQGTIRFNADTKEVDHALDGIDKRIDTMQEKFGAMLDPLMERLEQFSGKLDETRERTIEHILSPAGETVTGPTGVSVTPLGPNASMSDTTRLTVVVEDVYTQLLQLNQQIAALIAALQNPT